MVIYIAEQNCKLHRNRWMSFILLRFAHSQCLAATHSSSPEVGNGLNWPKPQCTCNAMVTSQAQHTVLMRECYAVIQRAQCWWATTCGCRNEESNLGPLGSETSALPLGHCLSLKSKKIRIRCVNIPIKMWVYASIPPLYDPKRWVYPHL